jgi:hypothetical protein
MHRVALSLALLWSSPAAANHDGLAEGILLMLVLVGACILLAAGALIATIWFIAQARKSASERALVWCRRLAVVDGLLALTSAILFVATGASGDSTKLFIPLIVFALAGAFAWKAATH